MDGTLPMSLCVRFIFRLKSIKSGHPLSLPLRSLSTYTHQIPDEKRPTRSLG